jgi:hypothetical protein
MIPTAVYIAVLFGGLGAWLVAQMLHAIPEKIVSRDGRKVLRIGTEYEYGDPGNWDYAKRSWMLRHYGVPFQREGSMLVVPGKNYHRIGMPRDTSGDYRAFGDGASFTIDVLLP